MPPAKDVYGGVVGRTRSERIQISCPCGLIYPAEATISVDAADVDLAGRFLAGELGRATCPSCGSTSTVELPIVYHDGARRLFLLVLPTWARHRELEERAALYLALAKDKEHAVPSYVRDFTVLFGVEALRGRLVPQVDRTAEVVTISPVVVLAPRDPEPMITAAAAIMAGGDQTPGPTLAIPETVSDADTQSFQKLDELIRDRAPAPAPRRRKDLSRPAGPRDLAIERWMVSGAPTAHVVEAGKVRLLARLAGDRLEPFLPGLVTARVQLFRNPTYPLIVIAVAPEPTPDTAPAEPLTFFLDLQRLDDRSLLGTLSVQFRVVLDLYDVEYLPVVHREVVAPLEDNVRSVVAAAEKHLSSVPVGQRSFDASAHAYHASTFDRYGSRAHNLDEDSFALLPKPGTAKMALEIVAFWSAAENEDYLLLVRSFPVAWWRRIRSRVMTRAVELGLALPDPLVKVAIDEGLARSRKDLVRRLVAAFADVVGGSRQHDLDTAAVADNWRALVAECEALGVALEGRAGDLAAVAVGALPPNAILSPQAVPLPAPAPPSRRTASPSGPIVGMAQPSSARVEPPRDPIPVAPMPTMPPRTSTREAAREPIRIPASVLAARAPGGPPPRASGSSPLAKIDREEPPAKRPRPEAGVTVSKRRDFSSMALEDLFTLLEDKEVRRDVCIELARRGDPHAAGPVFGALRRMTRGEAVRVFPVLVGFGERAVSHLVDGLRAKNAYLRQGCALALGVLKAPDGIEPLCDLLLSEPTDVWREVARALGEVGAPAVMSLAARLRDTRGHTNSDGERVGEARERIAWGLAHIAGRGGRAPIETLAGGRDPVAAAAARKALELATTARDNDAEVKAPEAPRDVTVNRAFSRKFFEAMTRGDRIRKGPNNETMQISEADLMADDEELLDDEDLLPG